MMRILLVDDHALFRMGVKEQLELKDKFQVVGQASNGKEAIQAARKLNPDVILMDIHMPECDGLEATRHIKQEMPETKIVILTVADDDECLFEAIKSGAQGYILKNMEPAQLYEFLHAIDRDEAPLSGPMASKILHEFHDLEADQKPQSAEDSVLTERETGVLELVVEGLTNKEIAAQLHISKNTVKIHLRNILDKLHLENRTQAAVHAVREGIVGEKK